MALSERPDCHVKKCENTEAVMLEDAQAGTGWVQRETGLGGGRGLQTLGSSQLRPFRVTEHNELCTLT